MTSLNVGDRISSRDVIKDVWIRGIMIAVQNVNKSRGLRTTFRRNDNSPPPSLPHSSNSSPTNKRLVTLGEVAGNERTWNALHLPPLDRFVRASNYVHQHRTLFTSEEALEFYGLWMQSTEGPASRFGTPFKNDYRERRKWDAWRSHKMKPQISAMLEYVSYLNATIDFRINEYNSKSKKVSVDATHLGLSIAKAKPAARDFENSSAYDNHHSRSKMQQNQQRRLGSFTPGIRQQRPSTATKSRQSSLSRTLPGSPINTTTTTNNNSSSGNMNNNNNNGNQNNIRFDNNALHALQQARPNTAPVHDTVLENNDVISSKLAENRRKAFRQYEFLNNLSSSRLYNNKKNSQLSSNISNTRPSPQQQYEKYSLKKNSFNTSSSSLIRGITNSQLAANITSSNDSSNNNNVGIITTNDNNHPTVVKIVEKNFRDDNHHLQKKNTADHSEFTIRGFGKKSRGRSYESKKRSTNNGKNVFPNIDGGLAREVNSGALSGW